MDNEMGDEQMTGSESEDCESTQGDEMDLHEFLVERCSLCRKRSNARWGVAIGIACWVLYIYCGLRANGMWTPFLGMEAGWLEIIGFFIGPWYFLIHDGEWTPLLVVYLGWIPGLVVFLRNYLFLKRTPETVARPAHHYFREPYGDY